MSITKIEWCCRPGTIPETWNPTTGCNKVSQGCKNCYAEIMHRRLQAMGQKKYSKPFLNGAQEHNDYQLLTMPLRWKKPRTVFVNSMSDLFHYNISFNFIDKVFAVMALAVDHTFIILTKRPHLMLKYFSVGKEALIERWANATYKVGTEEPIGISYDDDPDYASCWINNAIPQRWPLPNVWLGVSVEDQTAADQRIPLLIQTPATVRFLSCEPLLDGINFHKVIIPTVLGNMKGPALYGIDWVIAGGESGHNARPMNPHWVRSIRDQCKAVYVPFFFKQWGEYVPFQNGVNNTLYCAAGDTFGNYPVSHKQDDVIYAKPGKHKAGRKLDGQEYNEFPHSVTNTKV